MECKLQFQTDWFSCPDYLSQRVTGNFAGWILSLCGSQAPNGQAFGRRAAVCTFNTKCHKHLVTLSLEKGSKVKYSHELDWFYSQLSARFNTKDLGEIQKILGIRVTWNRRDRELFIDQEQYLQAVLDWLGFTDAPHRRKDTPLNGYDCLRSAKPEDRRLDAMDYQQAIGSIMYGMVFTRPDIAKSR